MYIMELANLSFNTDGHMHMILSRAPTLSKAADLKGKSHDEIYKIYNSDIQYRLQIENYCNEVIVNNNTNIDRLEQALKEKNVLISSLSDIETLKKENERLTEENKELKTDVTNLQEENTQLKKDIVDLKEANKISNKRIDELTGLVKEHLIPKIEQFEAQNIELSTKVQLLQARL